MNTKFLRASLVGLSVMVSPLLGCSSPGADAAPAGDAAATADTGDALVGKCGGTTIPKAGGGSWTCSFDEEFNGTTLDTTKWVVQETAGSGFTTGPGCFVNSKNNVSVSGGNLSLTVRSEAAPFTCKSPFGDYQSSYTAGSVSTYTKFSQAYGRFEVRARILGAKVKGLQESFWLWPDNDVRYRTDAIGYRWPSSGEIDIAEFYHANADRAIPFIHYVPKAYDPNETNNYCMIADIAQYHTYAAEWTGSTIKIIYDGKTCLTDTWNPGSPLRTPAPFDQPFMVALTQGLGIGGNAFDPKTTPLPATTQVDYVRVWR